MNSANRGNDIITSCISHMYHALLREVLDDKIQKFKIQTFMASSNFFSQIYFCFFPLIFVVFFPKSTPISSVPSDPSSLANLTMFLDHSS